MFDAELFWAEILSREPERIQAAYLSLPNVDERAAVYQHLQRMATEEGWQEPQRLSALAGLAALESLRA